ncbi:MAG: anticodon nuclease [Sulfurimonas sp.]|nr:anticodon nuclease [Sulfurimonas sp.]
MAEILKQIAQKLKDSSKKVQLIYAFNGVGKTRLSREFKELIKVTPSEEEDNEGFDDSELSQKNILYYSAFTEDLFYWDNDLADDEERKLKIHPNSFTNWVFIQQGQDQNVITNFQHYTNDKLTPNFNQEYTLQDDNDNAIIIKAFSEVTFSFKRGNEEPNDNIKISKGEESNFIWSIFYTLIEEVVSELNKSELDYDDTNPFHNIEYILIDDPVSSLDENHLIELAVNLAQLIKLSDFEKTNLNLLYQRITRFFYNVLFNELGLKSKKGSYMLVKNEDGSFELNEKYGDSNKSFSYHLYLRDTIRQAIINEEVSKYHFILLRNLYEKTANFLGYAQWSDLLQNDNREAYISRIMNFYSHRTLTGEEVAEPTEPEKKTVKLLFNHLINNSKFLQEVEQNES